MSIDPFSVLSKNSATVRKLLGGAEYTVRLRDHEDATEDECLDYALRGYALTVMPRKAFDLGRLGESWSFFKAVKITGPSKIYQGWKALESLRAVERLSIEGNPDVPIRLNGLPHLHTLGICGTNALSAVDNVALRHVGLNFSSIPRGFRIDSALESVGVECRKGHVAFDFLSEVSRLQRVTVWDAATVTLTRLADAHHLHYLNLENCAHVDDAIALAGLEELESVEFNGLRSVDNLEDLTKFTSKRIWAERNYLFDPEFINRAGGESRHWNVEKYRGAPRDMRAAARGENDDHPPFYVRPYAEALFQVAFDDWSEWEGLFLPGSPPKAELSDQLDFFAREAIRTADPDLLSGDEVYFDSDAESMRIITSEEPRAYEIVRILGTAWTDKRSVKRIARKTPSEK